MAKERQVQKECSEDLLDNMNATIAAMNDQISILEMQYIAYRKEETKAQLEKLQASKMAMIDTFLNIGDVCRGILFEDEERRQTVAATSGAADLKFARLGVR